MRGSHSCPAWFLIPSAEVTLFATAYLRGRARGLRDGPPRRPAPELTPHLLWPRAPVTLGRSGRSPRRSPLQRPPCPGARPVRPVVCLLLGLLSSPAPAPAAGRLRRGSQDDKLTSPTARGEAGCSPSEFGHRFPTGRASGRRCSPLANALSPPLLGPHPKPEAASSVCGWKPLLWGDLPKPGGQVGEGEWKASMPGTFGSS